MFVNAFRLLFFHYFLTGTVLWFMFTNANDSDPAPYGENACTIQTILRISIEIPAFQYCFLLKKRPFQ